VFSKKSNKKLCGDTILEIDKVDSDGHALQSQATQNYTDQTILISKKKITFAICIQYKISTLHIIIK
jgi:hypothetical protein